VSKNGCLPFVIRYGIFNIIWRRGEFSNAAFVACGIFVGENSWLALMAATVRFLMVIMAAAFDPYKEWLGVPAAEQPPDHYRLLNLTRFESDPGTILAAADQRMSYVRSFQTGRRARESQMLLNELAAAKLCLLNPKLKPAYDASLQQAITLPPAVPMSRPAPLPDAAREPAEPGGSTTLPLSSPAGSHQPPPPPPPPAAAGKSSGIDAVEAAPGATSGNTKRSGFPATLLVAAALLLVLTICGAVVGAVAYSRTPAAARQPVRPAPPPAQVKAVQPVTAPPVERALHFAGKELQLKPRAARLEGDVRMKNGAKGPALKGWAAAGSAATWRINVEGRGYFKLLVTGNPLADGDLTIELDGAVAGGVKRKRISFKPSDAGRKYLTSFIFASPGGVLTVTAKNSGEAGNDALELNAIVLQRSRRQ